ncbi:hypothetical protein [Agrococcus terreus]|uniref:RadC-like JAB domain-containing protein n=1 Tax=Agrococcus terreus TaxID=574649 RepID=A0ABQ2KHF8_9MICO|nr:hypothetical protein [Agrococcus terreus]GGN83281.1 hypothetical protein GCM10010968_13880 [Agrococcus terreus]
MDDIDPQDLLAVADVRLLDDAALLARARDLIGSGLVRRLWLLLLDDDGRQLPLLPQLDGIPVSPDGQATMTIRSMLGTLAEVGSQAVVVLERPGAPSASPDDLAWGDAIRRGARGIDLRLRGVLLAHGRGVDPLVDEPCGGTAA